MRIDTSYICDDLKTLKSDMRRLKRLKIQLSAICCKITASYGLNAGGGGGGLPSSQTENLIIRKDRLQRQINEISDKVRRYNEAFKTVLTPLEREIVYEIIEGGKLSQFARHKNIYKSTIYKLRDKAILKISEYLERE